MALILKYFADRGTALVSAIGAAKASEVHGLYQAATINNQDRLAEHAQRYLDFAALGEELTQEPWRTCLATSIAFMEDVNPNRASQSRAVRAAVEKAASEAAMPQEAA